MVIRAVRIRASATMTRLQQWYPARLGQQAVQRFSRHKGGTYAAALAYYALLSFFPFLILLVSLVSPVVSDPATRDRAVGFVVSQIPQAANFGDEIKRSIADLSGVRGGVLGVVGLLGSLLGASQVVGALRSALNDAFEVTRSRPYIRGRLIDLLAVLGLVALAVLWTALGLLLSVLAVIPQRLGVELAWLPSGWVLWPLSLFLTWTLTLLAYAVLPASRPGWRDLAIGAFGAALGIELVRGGFGFYIARFGRYDVVYGALGGVVAFLVFVYFVAMVALLGAQLAAARYRERAGPASGVSRQAARSSGG